MFKHRRAVSTEHHPQNISIPAPEPLSPPLFAADETDAHARRAWRLSRLGLPSPRRKMLLRNSQEPPISASDAATASAGPLPSRPRSKQPSPPLVLQQHQHQHSYINSGDQPVSPPTPSSDHSPPVSTVFSSDAERDLDAMSVDDCSSPSPSIAPARLAATTTNSSTTGPEPHIALVNSSAASSPRPPTLQDILSNIAPPPYTLAAFTAYLSQNHCLENLEFLHEADRYRARYEVVAVEIATAEQGNGSADVEGLRDELRRLWGRIVNVYVGADTPREVNLPGEVRNTLISQSSGFDDASEPAAPPPAPAVLDRAMKIIYELMNESVLMPFLHELAPAKLTSVTVTGEDRSGVATANASTEQMDESLLYDSHRRRGAVSSARSRSSSHRRGSPNRDTSCSLPLASPTRPSAVLAHSSVRRNNKASISSNCSAPSLSSIMTPGPDEVPRAGSTSPTTASRFPAPRPPLVGSSASATTLSPMTPPTTPPANELNNTLGPHSSSPKNRFQSADTAWRKMMGRLGPRKRASSNRTELSSVQ